MYFFWKAGFLLESIFLYFAYHQKKKHFILIKKYYKSTTTNATTIYIIFWKEVISFPLIDREIYYYIYILSLICQFILYNLNNCLFFCYLLYYIRKVMQEKSKLKSAT